MVPISDFCIYRPQNTDRKHGDHSLEMEPLHVVMGYRSSCQSLLFDALVSTDCGTKYVRGVPFETLAIDAYDPDVLSAADHISIQSRCFAGTKIWYHLEGSPSSEYKRYHEAFLWVADLAKHVIAFMDERENTKLADFRLDFHKWLGERYNLQAPGPVQNWLSKLQGKDFRKAIVAQADFLWKECSSVNETLCNEPLWQEINIIDQTCSSEKVNKRFSAEEEIGTVVTPFVWRNFSQLPDIQKFMTQKTAVEVLNDCAEHRKSMMGFTNADKAQKTAECNKRTTVKTKTKTKIEKGDCVAIWADEESSWKDGAEIWYGYVQDVRRDRRGDRFNILWLYEPQHTILSARYPYGNELFMSDHCNCGHDDSPVRIEHIAYKVAAHFMTGSKDSKKDFEFFIRQKYVKAEHAFVTLKDSDFQCICYNRKTDLEEAMQKHKPGDVVLVPRPECWSEHGSQDWESSENESKRSTRRQQSEPQILDPVVIHEFGHTTVTVRRLLRRKLDLHDCMARPNELVWTYEFAKVPLTVILTSQTRCHVRWFKEGHDTAHKIPVPYNRDGAGNFWYIRSHIRNGQYSWETLEAPPAGLNQGWNPYEDPVKTPLKGLDLFCGGGNFGRGIAEGGAVHMAYAIDWNSNAVASYRANEPPGKEGLVDEGCVNKYLAEAMSGHGDHHKIASVNDIDFIAAGSPCQGFSALNNCKQSDRSLRNISMVASVAAYIDFYRPKYAILENVVAMTNSPVFQPLLCCFVGMGYQVSTSLIDAWSHGSPQGRSRVFILISAPGLVPQHSPQRTHSHPPHMKQRSLGRSSADSTKFGERTFGPTPFKFVSASEAMDDLPWIGDGRLQVCLSHPDHRTVSLEPVKYREIIHYIPTYPPDSSIMRAIEDKKMPEHFQEWCFSTCSDKQKEPGSNAYRRINGDNLTWTISTTTNQHDANNGCILHWKQHRVLTILEARRAQSFPDHEVLIGTPRQQWAIVGNSVARTVALALGMTLRESWLANAENDIPRTCIPTTSAGRSISCHPGEPSTTKREAPPAPAQNSDVIMSIRKKTVEKTSVKRSSTSQQTRSGQYTQDTVRISQETTIQTTTRMAGPSTRPTQHERNKTKEDKKSTAQRELTIISLSGDTTEVEDDSVPQKQTASGSNKVNNIIDLSDDTAEESEQYATASNNKLRSPSKEIKSEASPAARGFPPEVIDLTSSDDEPPKVLKGKGRFKEETGLGDVVSSQLSSALSSPQPSSNESNEESPSERRQSIRWRRNMQSQTIGQEASRGLRWRFATE